MLSRLKEKEDAKMRQVRVVSILLALAIVASAIVIPSALADGRQPTGVGQSLRFGAGATVQGFRIVLDNGQTFGSCRIDNAPTGGTLTDGVINPDGNEKAAMQLCSGATQAPVAQPAQVSPSGRFSPATFWYIWWGDDARPVWVIQIFLSDGSRLDLAGGPAFRRLTGVGGTVRFDSGERVAGFKIVYDDGSVFNQCWLDTSQGGSVTDGVINPFNAERQNLQQCR